MYANNNIWGPAGGVNLYVPLTDLNVIGINAFFFLTAAVFG